MKLFISRRYFYQMLDRETTNNRLFNLKPHFRMRMRLTRQKQPEKKKKKKKKKKRERE